MGVCLYCGEKAGWFSDVHDACIRSAQEGCEQATSLITATSRNPSPLTILTGRRLRYLDQLLWTEVKPQINHLATEHRIPTDQLRKTLRKGWSAGAERPSHGGAHEIPDRLHSFEQLLRAMGFTGKEMRPDSSDLWRKSSVRSYCGQ